jgi:hypothetical protein
MEDGMAAAPISGQFWFVRDLMLLVILTPIVYTFIKKLGRYLVAFLGLLWMFDCWFVYPYPCVRAVFFFTLGAWFGINKRNLVVEAEKVKYYAFVLYPILVIADLLTKGGEANLFIHRVGVLCGIPFWLNVGLSSMRTMVIATAKYEAVKAASVLGFSHINKSFWTALRSKGSWIANIKKDAIERYLLGRITIVLIGLGSYYVLRKISPSFTNFITGGR